MTATKPRMVSLETMHQLLPHLIDGMTRMPVYHRSGRPLNDLERLERINAFSERISHELAQAAAYREAMEIMTRHYASVPDMMLEIVKFSKKEQRSSRWKP